MSLRLERISRVNVKFVIPSAGVFAFYLGGLLGAWACTLGKTFPSGFTLLLAIFTAATLLGFGVMTAVDNALGEAASHVDIIVTVLWMTGALAAVLIERRVGDWLGWALPQFFENLVVWGAGVASIWEREPDFPGWPAVRADLERRLRRLGRR